MLNTPAETRITFESARDIAAMLVPDPAKMSFVSHSSINRPVPVRSTYSELSVFKRIAETNHWGSPESISGSGSTMAETEHLRGEMARLLGRFAVRSMVDAPCGDMNWMRHLDYRFERFIGIDIVESIIHTLKTEPFPPSHHFQTGNIVTDILPQADLLFCRDCLVHLPLAAIAQVQLLWKPGRGC